MGPHGNPAADLMSDTPRVQLELTNKGMTAAYDVAYETWIEILPRPFGDFTINAIYFKDINRLTLYPNARPIVINVPLGRELGELERAKIRHWDLHTCVRIRMEYRDARQRERYAEFGFHVMHEGFGFLAKYQGAN